MEKYKISEGQFNFNLIQCDIEGEEIFHITPENKIISNNIDITHNDSAIADCFRKWIEIWRV